MLQLPLLVVANAERVQQFLLRSCQVLGFLQSHAYFVDGLIDAGLGKVL